MREQEISVRTSGGEMTTFVCYSDDGGPFPVAVLYMDDVGHRDQIKQNARRLAADGYCCVAPDLFYRSGEKLSFDFSRMGEARYRARLMGTVERVRPDAVIADTRAVFEAIADDRAAASGAKVCVGYCIGPGAALHAAAAMPDRFVAAAGIHPGAFITDEPDSRHHDPFGVYFAFAERDQSATAENVDRFRGGLQRQSIKGLVERLPATAHRFAMADLPVYDREAAERHFQRILELWRRNLAQEGARSSMRIDTTGCASTIRSRLRRRWLTSHSGGRRGEPDPDHRPAERIDADAADRAARAHAPQRTAAPGLSGPRRRGRTHRTAGRIVCRRSP
jgi:carboxymethylenebutenolidase